MIFNFTISVTDRCTLEVEAGKTVTFFLWLNLSHLLLVFNPVSRRQTINFVAYGFIAFLIQAKYVEFLLFHLPPHPKKAIECCVLTLPFLMPTCACFLEQ